ncbi:V-type ATP synthase subunit F, partial [Dysosmobacter welbionis]
VRDPRHESGGIALTPGDGGQLLLPLRREHGRGQSIRQDGDQVDPRLGRDETFPFALHKPGRHQLLQDRRPGGRGAQALALGVLRHLLFPGSLHRRQEGVLRVRLGRG